MEIMPPVDSQDKKTIPSAAERFYARYPRDQFVEALTKSSGQLGEGEADAILELVDIWGGAPGMLSSEQDLVYRKAIEDIEAGRRASELHDRLGRADVQMGAIAAKRLESLQATRGRLERELREDPKVEARRETEYAQETKMEELMQPTGYSGRRSVPSSDIEQIRQHVLWNGTFGPGTPGGPLRVNTTNVNRK